MKPQIQILDIPIPETLDIERQVLADITNYQDMMGDVFPLIHPSFFTNDARRGIWETIVDRFNRGEDFGLASLWNLLPAFKEEVLPKTGRDDGRIAVFSHVNLLRTAAARRRFYLATVSSLQRALNPSSTEQDIIAGVETLAAEVEGPAPIQAEVTIRGALDEVSMDIDAIERSIASGQKFRIATGFPLLDETLNGGFRPGQLVVLAARPGVGKTSIMLHIAKNAARDGFPVYISTLEMNSRELGEKFIFSTGQVRPFEINNGRVDKSRMKAGRADLDDLPIQINSFSRSLDEIVGRITQAVKRGKCRVAMVDYIGLIRDCSRLGGGVKLNQILGIISKTLKSVAQRLGITIIVLSQLNREAVRDGRSPELYDLRDSGDLEQDADIVLMLESDKKQNRIIAWLRKSRNGKHKDENGGDFGFTIYPNDTYSSFTEGPTINEKNADLPPCPPGQLLPPPAPGRMDPAAEPDDSLPF